MGLSVESRYSHGVIYDTNDFGDGKSEGGEQLCRGSAATVVLIEGFGIWRLGRWQYIPLSIFVAILCMWVDNIKHVLRSCVILSFLMFWVMDGLIIWLGISCL